MPAYKELDPKTGKIISWKAVFRYTDWTGARKTTTKRGFAKKSDALDYIDDFLKKQEKNLNMGFSAFVEIYFEDMENRIKENTMETKRYIFNEKIIPFFEKKKINEVSPSDIIQWQNELLAYRNDNGIGYTPTYLKTIHNQLSTLFNHAVKFYGLRENPARKAGNMGKEKTKEMEFWTKEEYMKFSQTIMDKDGVYQAFETLYWLGLRMGEMLALTPSDFDFDKETVSITKSYQRIRGRDVITDPKTEKGNRVIVMPHFLAEELKDYIRRLYDLDENDRIFVFSKSMLHHEMDRGCKLSGVKRISIHSLRHSAISLLCEMGYSAVDIANRVGHESIDITYRYAHMFPSRDTDMARSLDGFRGGAFDETENFKKDWKKQV